jgi:putative hydrolase of the HAD superfamily
MDYGEVLCLLPSSQDINRIAKIFRMNPQSFLPIYMQSRAPYDRGDVSPAEYWDNFAAQAGVKIDPRAIEDIRCLDTEMWCRHNEPMIRWVEQIHAAGYKTAILSNMHLDLAAHLRKNFPWLGNFDHYIFSAEARSVKPEPAIYQRTIQTLGVKPAAALFIDDREENLDQARVAGIRTIRFQSIPQLREDLQGLGFAILPG